LSGDAKQGCEMIATTDAPKFELRGGVSWRNPFGSYAALRDRDPVHHVADGDFYVLTRFADVWAAAGDPATFSSARGLTVSYGEIEAAGMGAATPMVFLDPPEHTAFRALVTKKLTPRKVATIEPAVRAFVVDRLRAMCDVHEADIVAELFKPLPSFVVAHYLGVPAEDRVLFDHWTEAIVQAAASGDPTAAGDPFAELLSYFAQLVARRRIEPGDDIVSDLTALGEDNVTTARILGFAFTMVTGGNDTITGLLSGSACLLTEHRDQRAMLVARPELIPNAVEELLRLTSPVQNLARTATRNVEVHGVTIPEGKKVLLCYAAANRDDREFGATADQLDVERSIKKILTLSYGTHYCIGAAAARLQGRVVLEELLRRCPDFHVDVDAGVYAQGAYVRRHLSLPWTAS
jgi:cytochrome P450 family 130